MAGIVETLSSIDLSQLSAQLDRAHTSVETDVPAALASLDPRALLGDFGKLFDAGALAKADPKALLQTLEGMVGQLGQLAQSPVPATFSTVVQAVESFAKIIEQIAAQFGGPGSLLDRVLQGSGGLEKVLGDVLGRAADLLPFKLPDSLGAIFGSLEALSKGTLADPREAAALLSRLLTGLELDALGAPGQAFDQFAARIRGAGGDFAAVQAGMQSVAAQIEGVSALLLRPELDVAAAASALTQAQASFELLVNDTLAAALARLSQDLAALDPGAFAARLRDLLSAIPAAVPGVQLDLDAELATPLRGLSDLIDQLTPASIASACAGLKQTFTDAAGATSLSDLFESIDGVFDILVEEIEAIGLDGLRDEVVTFLVGLEARLRDIPGLDTPHLFGDEIRKVEQAIDGIDTASIQQRVKELADKVDGIGQKFPINDIKGAVEGLVGNVQQALDQIKPALDALGKQLDDLGTQLDGIDFNAPGQASIGLIHGIRDQVEKAVGSGDLPEPAKLAIGAAAQALKALDVRAEISAPFNAALAGVDPKLVLEPIDPALSKVRQVLETVSPKAIIDRLDQPFQQLLAELEKLRPANLLAGLSADFAKLVDLVGKLDPRSLVAPLDAEFQKVVHAVGSAIDPAPLFAPLHAAYAKLQQLFDLIDLETLFGRLLDSFGGLPTKLADTLQTTAAQKSPGAQAAPTGSQQPLKFGDLVRPLVAIINQVKSVVARAAAQVIGEALDLLQTPLALLSRLAEGGHQLITDVADALDGRLAEIDPFAASGPALRLREALTELQLVADGLSDDAQAQLGPLVASLELSVRVDALAGPLDGLQAECARIRDGVALTDLVAQLNRLEASLGQIAPGPLRDGSLTGEASARVTALFAFLDLEPLAKEMDDIGDKIQAKLLSLGSDLAQNTIDLWSALLDLVLPIMPLGVFKRIQDGMTRVRTALAFLDPTPIEAEARHLLDVGLALLEEFSPTKLVADLGGIVDSVRAKLAALDPAALLGQLDPLAAVIDGMQALKPSVVLAPLLEETKGITLALEALTKLPFGDALIQASAKLKVELETVVAGVEQELQGLLDFLENLSGGGPSVSVSAG